MEYQIIIQNSKGETKIEPFTKPSVAIGKSLDNDIVLPQQGVSRRHAKLYREASRILIEDLNSTNGTFVNEVQIQGRTEVQPGDTIRIGTFSIAVRPLEEKQIRSASGKIPRVRRTASGSIERDLRVVPGGEGRKGEPRFAHYSHQELIKEIHARLLEIMDLRRMSFDKIGDEDLREKTKATIINIIDDMKEEIPPSVSRPELLKDVLNEALGLGPLEDLIADPTITEIMVNRADRIYIERGGKIVLCDKTFSSDNAVLQVIERIVAPIGRRIDESSPMVDARLKNGSRVNAI
ncbi:MAG: FHA domain-containing protein, partial [Deltaproteobacteria bacterium]